MRRSFVRRGFSTAVPSPDLLKRTRLQSVSDGVKLQGLKDVIAHDNEHEHCMLNNGHCCHFHQFSMKENRAYSTSNEKQPIGDPVVAIEQNKILYGRGALNEVGAAAKHTYGAKRVALFTDKRVKDLECFHIAKQSLLNEGIDVVTYDEVAVEPTDQSFLRAARFSKEANVDTYVSVGGGSVLDTCKAADLYATFPVPDEDFLLYVNKPIGKGKLPKGPLRPHIACPTTAGTGSETTGIAIFDMLSMNCKTGIAHVLLRPSLAIVDPLVTYSLPSTVCAAAGFDVLAHALESYTAIPNIQKKTAARTPTERYLQRPIAQGSNRWADLGCLEALTVLGKNIVRAMDKNDKEARENMLYASLLAGIAFGNVGCHAPHAMSYSVSGMVKNFRAPDYPQDEPFVPHGMSVILNAPAVFKFTCSASPNRHYEAAKALGADVSQINPDNTGEIAECLYQHLIFLMKATKMPNGLAGVGYTADDIPLLAQGAEPQRRLLDNAPMPIHYKELVAMYTGALKYW